MSYTLFVASVLAAEVLVDTWTNTQKDMQRIGVVFGIET